ncbi:hypothetical protein LINPERHAP2_LOCUS15016 [Linum perenne]
MGDEMIDIVIRHGGRIDFSGSEPKYIGGEENVVGFHTDYLCIASLWQLRRRILVIKLFIVCGGSDRELFGDMDILYGLILDVKKVEDGQVVMFFEAKKEVSGGWDNEDGNMGDDEGMNLDDDVGAENSVQPPYTPFIVVSDESGESDQGAVERSMSDMNLTPNSSSTEYRQSSESDRIRPNLSDEGSYDAVDYEPIQGVRRDFSNVRLRQGMKFIDSAAFKDFVASYCLYIGADIMWLKSCQSKMEVVCRDHCGWRVYGSWSSKKDSFILKCLGDNHTCAWALENKQASAKWIAKTYLEKFRVNPKWDVGNMERELQLTYEIHINDNKCYRARNEARTLLEGTLEDEYKKLRPYVAALQNADPERQFVLEVDI